MGQLRYEGSTIGVEASESHCESKTAQGASLVMTGEGFRRPMRRVSQVGLKIGFHSKLVPGPAGVCKSMRLVAGPDLT
jgi:hypothetical protein